MLTAPVAGFPLLLDRRALAGSAADDVLPDGAVRDAAGDWVAGDVRLSDRDALARELGVSVDSTDLTLALAAVARFGVDAPARLHGEYAFVAWHAGERQLFAARDGLGLRLLYVAVTADRVAFSGDPSELGAVQGVDGALNPGALAAFLTESMDADLTRTMFRGVTAIPAGHTWLLGARSAQPRLQRHWFFPLPAVGRPRDARELPRRFSFLLDEAVRDRVRGPRASILLSGGLDSSLIAASVRRTRPDVALRGFTATFEPLVGASELPWAQRVGAALGIEVEEVPSATASALAHLAASRFPSPLDEPTWLEWLHGVQAASRWSNTVLYGEDGDALQLPATLREMLRVERWPALAAALLSFTVRQRRLPHLGTGLKARLIGGRHGGPAAPRLPWLAEIAYRASEPAPTMAFETLVEPRSRASTQRRLTSPLVQQWACIFASPWTQSRAAFTFPLLDDRLLEFALSIPSVPWCHGKQLMRSAAVLDGQLPAEVIWRPKTPLYGHGEALVAEWRARWDGALSVAPEIAPWILERPLRRALREGSVNDVSDAWRVLELSSWLEYRRLPAD